MPSPSRKKKKSVSHNLGLLAPKQGKITVQLPYHFTNIYLGKDNAKAPYRVRAKHFAILIAAVNPYHSSLLVNISSLCNMLFEVVAEWPSCVADV